MSSDPVTIVDYDPDWPREYAATVAALREAVGETFEAFEHIGSTAVPGLAARPIIDVMAGVEMLADAEAAIEPLEAGGWDYRAEFEATLPERRYFRKTASNRHTHHLHVVEVGGAFWERHLGFRDHLRDHPPVARRYETLKRELAAANPHDSRAYGEAKAAFIDAVEAEALDQRGADESSDG